MNRRSALITTAAGFAAACQVPRVQGRTNSGTVTLRRAADRFHTQVGWLDSRHTFSFGNHYDPAHMGFRALRVINEDHVEAGAGFPTHPHRDMEIISYVLEGALEHKDSMGNGSVITPGEVQRMSAGTGVLHSEVNPSARDEVHFLQIWLLPQEGGLTPSYEQRTFKESDTRGRLRLVASGDGREGSVTIHQDTSLYAGVLARGERSEHRLRPGRHAWVHVARGSVHVNGHALVAGDGAAISDAGAIQVDAQDRSEVLFFDLA